MGFFKNILNSAISKSLGKKAFTSNPYIGLIIDADESDVIADELFTVALAYRDGEYMLPQNNEKALEYCLKAAERGHVVAQLFAAMWYMDHNDDHNDNVLYWLSKAAEQGERQSLYNLGISYHRGDINGKVDIDQSNIHFRAAAEKLYGAACARMAMIYLNGEDGIESNKSIAKFWAWEAHINGDQEDGALLFHLLEEGDTIGNKLNWKKVYEEAAEAGERFAYHIMGNAYIEENEEVSVDYWNKAVSLGCKSSMYNLGITNNKLGHNEKAFELIKIAAENGDEIAQCTLAKMLYGGIGVYKNIEEAWYWHEKSLNFGYNSARYLLTSMYANNELQEILPDNIGRAAHYMELASMNDNETN